MTKPARLKTTTRDVHIHAAVTIMPLVNDVGMIGEKEIEIGQFAVPIFAKHLPITEKEWAEAWAQLGLRTMDRARKAGLLR